MKRSLTQLPLITHKLLLSSHLPSSLHPLWLKRRRGDDNDDLQALFDSVSAEALTDQKRASGPAASMSEAGEPWSQQETVFNRIGQMARTLHDTLSQLGYDKFLEKTVTALPDAKDRLAYVANLTEQAACRVLNATDVAGPLVDEIENCARTLGERWNKVFANQMGAEDFKQLAIETRAFLNSDLPQKPKRRMRN